MGCGHHGHQRGHHGHGEAFSDAPRHDGARGCGCHRDGGPQSCGPSAESRGFQRRFQSKEERLAVLEQYREELTKELKAVEERIAEIRSGA